MQDTWDLPHYTNVQMPFPGRPPTLPEIQPTGVYERSFVVPAAWRGRRVVLHVGAAESVLIVRLNGIEIGLSKDSHLAAEFDVTERVMPARTNELRLTVVKWSDATYIEDQDQWWHGGITRSVYLYVTDPVHIADIVAIAGLADDLTTGHAGPRPWTWACPRGPRPRAGPSRRRSPGCCRPSAPRPSSAARARGRSSPSPDATSSVAPAAVADDAEAWAAAQRDEIPPLDRPGALGAAPSLTSHAGPRRPRCCTTSRSPSATRPARSSRRTASRVGFRRVEIRGLDLLINGERVFIRGVNRHDFDQHTGRVVSVESMRADLVQMKRFGFNAVRTSHYPNDPAFLDLTDELGMYVIDEADIESHAFQSTLCDDPRYLAAVGRAGVADGPARQEPPLGHRLVAGQRVRPRREPRGRGGLGPPRTIRPGRSTTRAPSASTGPATSGISDLTCPMYPPIERHRRARPLRTPAPPADHVRVLPRDGQQQRHARRVLGRDRVDARPAGRLHLGVVGPRPASRPSRTARPAGPTAATSATTPHDGNFCTDGLVWPDRTPEAGPVGAPGAGGAGRHRASTPRPSD